MPGQVGAEGENEAEELRGAAVLFTRLKRLLALLLPLASLGIFLWFVFRFFNYVEDDAFIPMRYALNFWRGYGWVMNPGERVEGYTSPLQLWILTILLRFLDPDSVVFVLKGIGVVLGCLILFQVRAIAATFFQHDRWVANLTMLILASRPEFALSMINALETSFATWFLVGGIHALLVEQSESSVTGLDTRKRQVEITLWFLGAAFARPELVPLFPALTLLRWLFYRYHPWRTLLLYLVPLCLFLMCRWLYYGDLLPNTYYAKRTPLGNALEDGWHYLVQYGLPVQSALAGFCLLLPGLIYLVRTSARATLVVLLIPLLWLFCFVLVTGGTWMVDGRFLTPVLPFLALLLAAVPLWLRDRLTPHIGSVSAVEGTVGILLCLYALFVFDVSPRIRAVEGHPFIGDLNSTLAPAKPLARWKSGNVYGRRRIADWISVQVRAGELVAFTEMGLVPLLHMDIRFLDLRGLTDRKVARMTQHAHSRVGVATTEWANPRREMWTYIKERHPDWVTIFDSDIPPDKRIFTKRDGFTLYGDQGDTWYFQTWKGVTTQANPNSAMTKSPAKILGM